jgi:type I restriction enzyme S subunit
MAGEWVETTLGEVIELKRGYDLPQQNRRPGAVPVVSSSGVTDQHAEAMAKGPGVVTGRYGTLGQVFYIEQDFWPLNTTLYVRDFKGNDPRFISYFLRGLDFLAYSDKAAVPGLNRNHLHQARVVVPTDVAEQRAIAHILGTLDDKIELNRRMSETLEAMARALFKSWFVDFDPVRAKAEGRDPGLPKPLADLFPARLVDSELGEIPEGWGVGVLGDVLAQCVDRCAPSAETRSRPYVPIECIAPRSLLLSESKPGEEAQSSLTRFRKGDLLFGAMRPYFHKVAIAPFDGTTRTTVFVLRPRQAEDFSFAALLLHDPKTIEYATNHSTGSTIPYAVWQDSLEEMPIVVPPAEVRRSFDKLVRPLLTRIPPVFFENRTLAALRDTLLPKLISGELRVKDADTFMERVVS